MSKRNYISGDLRDLIITSQKEPKDGLQTHCFLTRKYEVVID